jgi:hypothetical protein
MMKTVSALFLAGIAAVQLAPPAQAAFTNYTTIVGKKNGDHKAAAAPTPAPGPIAKSSPGTHKAAPTPTPVPLQSINVLKMPIKKP